MRSQSDIEQLFPLNSRWIGWRTRDGDRLDATGTVVEIHGKTVVLDFGSRRFRLSVDGTNVKVLGDEPGIGSAFITTHLNLAGRVVGTELSFEGTEVRLGPKGKRQLDPSPQNVKFVLRREDGPVQQDKTSEEIGAPRPSPPAESRAKH